MRDALRILLVEDNDDDAYLFAHAIEMSHASIMLRRAIGQKEGINYLRGINDFANRSEYPLPDLIVTALVMKNGSGVEFFNWCRTSQLFSQLPIVVLSDCLECDPELHLARQLGIDPIYEKTGDSQRLAAIVREICDLGLSRKVKHAYSDTALR